MNSRLRQLAARAFFWLIAVSVAAFGLAATAKKVTAPESPELALVGANSATFSNTEDSVAEIKIRMRGSTGTEIATLEIGGATVDTWRVLPSFQIYTVSTALRGDIQLRFINDVGQQDLQVDYLSINGHVLQAEDQPVNTGVWNNGDCGSGGHSEMLHCNGYITFGSTLALPSKASASRDPCNGNCQIDQPVRLTQN